MMKIVFDENISPRIVRAISENVRGDSLDLLSIYSIGLTSNEDETWLEVYAKSGGKFFVSGDRKMLNRPTLLKIILEHDLVGFFFQKSFTQNKRIMQLAYAAYWWLPIEAKLSSCSLGEAWTVPNDFSGSALKRVDMNSALKGLL